MSIEALLEENLKQKALREKRRREKEEKEAARREALSVKKEQLMKTKGCAFDGAWIDARRPASYTPHSAHPSTLPPHSHV